MTDSVTQINSSSAVSAAGNKNTTDQTVDQSAGGSSGGSAVQYADQKAGNTQDATSDATSHQIGASNANYPVRIGSPGGGGSVTQVNASGALSAAGNKNETNQTATQDAGGPIVKQLPLSDGCSDKCGQAVLRRLPRQVRRWRRPRRAGRQAEGVQRPDRRLVGGVDAVLRAEHQRAGSHQELRRRR